MRRHASVLVLLMAATTAAAHPMGNFAICHYAKLRAEANGLHIRFLIDLAEIPTVGEKQRLDRNGDGQVSAEEQDAYLEEKTRELSLGLSVSANGAPLPLRQIRSDMRLLPGAAGLDTMIVGLDLLAPFPSGEIFDIHYQDRTYVARTGWKEVIAVAGSGATLRRSSVPATDRSRELTLYPEDEVPPQNTEARLQVVRDPAALAPSATSPLPTERVGRATPRDAFTEAIAAPELALSVVTLGLAIAFIFGALHALSPGHGKAMAAAYLIGSRSTMRHAFALGLVVTITHTLGVFVLGAVALLLSRYIVPERLYPILGIVSGLTVCGVGGNLLYWRIRRLLRGAASAKAPSQHGHSHMPEGPLTPRALIALGISGGLIPCPSALVVLLAAVALHRIAYGMLLITAFSLGLASVLVALGLLVVRARAWLEGVRVSGSLLRRIPVVSATTITVIGLALVARSLAQFSL